MDNLYYGKQLWDYEDVNFLIDEFMVLYILQRIFL